MMSKLLGIAVGALLVFGATGIDVAAQGAKAPLTQPTTEPPSPVQATATTLGSVRVPRNVMADGKPLAAGTYQVRVTTEEAAGRAPGATPTFERYVEFLQGGAVKGREVASIVPDADIAKVAKGRKPAAGGAKVELLKGNDFLRVWINRGGAHYLVHLPVAA